MIPIAEETRTFTFDYSYWSHDEFEEEDNGERTGYLTVLSHLWLCIDGPAVLERLQFVLLLCSRRLLLCGCHAT